MKDIYYIVLTIVCVLNFCLRYIQSKKHPTTGNSKVFFEINLNLQWLKIKIKKK